MSDKVRIGYLVESASRLRGFAKTTTRNLLKQMHVQGPAVDHAVMAVEQTVYRGLEDELTDMGATDDEIAKVAAVFGVDRIVFKGSIQDQPTPPK